MTTARMKLVSRLMGFLGALLLAWLVAIMNGAVVVQTVGAAAEALLILATPDTPTSPLPLGSWAALVFENPTFRTMVATMFAMGLWLTTFLSVRGLVLLVEDGRGSSSWRDFLSEHLLHCLLLTGLFITAFIAVFLDWKLWLLRSQVDLLLGAKPWLDLSTGSGGNVGDVARHVARVAAFAVPAITVGFAVGLEASWRFCGRAWNQLGVALGELRAMSEADAYLDEVVDVIGAERGVRKVTRGTAAANPDEFVVSNEEVFSREYVKGLEKYKPESNGNAPRYRPRGFLARWLASGFGIALALLALSSQGVAGERGALDVVRGEKAAEVWLADADTKPSSQGMLEVIGAVDVSRSRKKDTVLADVEAFRTMVKGLAELRPADPRHPRTARVAIYLLSIDSMSEVVWSGTELTVDELNDAWWAAMMAERQSYGACTSLASVWVKVRELISRARPCDAVSITLWTDLQTEEPMRSNPSKCGPRQLGPTAEVPWRELARVNLIRAYRVPSATKAAWQKALREHGLESKVKMYAAGTDPGGNIPVIAPPEACPPTAEEQARFNGVAKKVAIVIGLIIAASVLLPFVL